MANPLLRGYDFSCSAKTLSRETFALVPGSYGISPGTGRGTWTFSDMRPPFWTSPHGTARLRGLPAGTARSPGCHRVTPLVPRAVMVHLQRLEYSPVGTVFPSIGLVLKHYRISQEWANLILSTTVGPDGPVHWRFLSIMASRQSRSGQLYRVF